MGTGDGKAAPSGVMLLISLNRSSASLDIFAAMSPKLMKQPNFLQADNKAPRRGGIPLVALQPREAMMVFCGCGHQEGSTPLRPVRINSFRAAS